ncbi:MAG: restriction endonuclease subunit S [Cyclobacteriaceae bacterium]
MSEKLPHGWVNAELSELAKVQSGGTPSRSNSRYWNGEIPWVKISDIKDLYVSETDEFITQEGLDNSSTRIFPKGTILFTIFATIGRIGILEIEATTNQAIAGITPSKFIDSKYLTYSLLNLSIAIQGHGKGVAQKNINQSILKSTLIPIPPLPEQKRIVAKLDALFGHLDTLKTKLDRIPELLKNFRQQVLTQAVTGKLTEEWREGKELEENGHNLLKRILKERRKRYEDQVTKAIESGIRKPKKLRGLDDEYKVDQVSDVPDSWSRTVVDKIGLVQVGATPSRKENNYWNGQIPWVSSGEVANNRIIDTAERITDEGFRNSSVKLNSKGSVLIAMIGEGKTRGQSAILDIEACTNQNIAAVELNSNHVKSEYLWFHFLANYEKNRSSGRGGNQPALNGKKIGEIFVNLPPLVEQDEIIKRVESLFDLAVKIESQYQSLKAKIDNLPQAILNKAFKGELVDQDPNDEPASELLKRIQNEKGGKG